MNDFNIPSKLTNHSRKTDAGVNATFNDTFELDVMDDDLYREVRCFESHMKFITSFVHNCS
jgi:hypothetical protein